MIIPIVTNHSLIIPPTAFAMPTIVCVIPMPNSFRVGTVSMLPTPHNIPPVMANEKKGG